MIRPCGRTLAVASLLAAAAPLGFTGTVSAQTAPAAAWRRTIEISGGVDWLGSADLGAREAVLTRNAPGDPSFPLFNVDGRQRSAWAGSARIAFYPVERCGIEGGLTVGQPSIAITVAGDFEAADPLVVAGRVTEYRVEASLVVHLLRPGRLVPFVTAGMGYLRQLHEGRSAVEEGRTSHAGGGIKYLLAVRQDRWIGGVGVRADVGLLLRHGGVRVDRDPRSSPRIGAGMFLLL